MKNLLSYPNFSEHYSILPVYDISRWMGAMKDVYIKLHLGASKNDSVEQATKDWDYNEKREFLNWLKYYESGDQMKYKRAQNAYYVNDDINYFLPNPKAPLVPSPIRSMNDQMANIPQEAAQAAQMAAQKQNELSKEDKRRMIEEQRKKILGRLNSAEKLLSSQQGQVFAGPDFERLLSAIYELKKQIQTVNKMTLSAQTIVDLIIRQANILGNQGYRDASDFMVKFAQQTPGDFSMNLGDTPAGGSQPQGGGSLSNPPPDLTQPPGGPQGAGGADAGAEPATPPSGTDSKDITNDSAIGKFIENLEDFGLTPETEEEDDIQGEGKDQDKNVAKDEVDVGDDDVMLDQEIVPDGNELVVHAQAVPEDAAPVAPAAPAARPARAPEAQAPAENLEVESPAPAEGGDAGATGITPEEAKNGPEEPQVKNDFDALIDSAFANLTIADVVRKLEDINKIFRNREISRQLAIVDVMLDHMGLAPYFPTLAEATNKQLEANQYVLTRIEDILSKLRGTMDTSKIDLKNENQKISPEAQGVANSLEQEEQKENQRKQVKKQIQDQTALEKATKPQGEVEGAPQELAAEPTEIEPPSQHPARPPLQAPPE